MSTRSLTRTRTRSSAYGGAGLALLIAACASPGNTSPGPSPTPDAGTDDGGSSSSHPDASSPSDAASSAEGGRPSRDAASESGSTSEAGVPSNPDLVVDCSAYDASTWVRFGGIGGNGPTFGSLPIPDPNGATDAEPVSFTDPRSGFWQVLQPALAPHTTYTATVYTKAVSGAPALYLGYYPGNAPVTQYSAKIAPGSAWQASYGFTFTTGTADTAPAIVVTNANVDGASQGNVGIAGLWGLKVEKGSTATPFTGCAGTAPDAGAEAGPPTGRPYLVGEYMHQTDSPTFSSFAGYPPDFTISCAYIGPGAENSGQLASCGLGDYPAVFAASHYQPYGSQNSNGAYPSYASATSAAGCTGTGASCTWAGLGAGYNGTYDAGFHALYGAGYKIYAIRLDWEWSGDWYDHSPYDSFNGSNGGAGPGCSYQAPCSPSSKDEWIAGFRAYALTLKHSSNPTIAGWKIAWDYPLDSQGVNALDYYPGDDVVDIVSSDIYANNYNGSNSAQSWATYFSGASQGYTLQAMLAFAAQHHKPIAFWEAGDAWGDGAFAQELGHFLDVTAPAAGVQVAAISWWDSPEDGGNNQPDVPIEGTTSQLDGWVCGFGATSTSVSGLSCTYGGPSKPSQYGGGYFAPLALPSSLPAGY